MGNIASKKRVERRNREVLLLNSNHRAIYTITLKRSLKLLENKKAYIIESEGILRSPNINFERPTVIALKEYRNIPKPKYVPINFRLVSIRDEHTCQYCSGPGETIDHIVPKSRGGLHIWENVVLCCRRCNSLKGSKFLSELNWRLKRKPAVPNIIRVRVEEARRDGWKKYI